jgi:hypothetical protein
MRVMEVNVTFSETAKPKKTPRPVNWTPQFHYNRHQRPFFWTIIVQ